MKTIAALFLLSIPLLLSAQLFTDHSANLPDNGARGQSMDVRAADLDGDGDLDIVLANEFQANTILLNDGNGMFTNGTAGNLPQEVHDSEDVVIADLNGDEAFDLVFCSEDDVTLGWSNVHEYYLGDGTGSFTPAGYQAPDTEANAVISADITGDGFPDLLFGNDGGTGVLVNAGEDPGPAGIFIEENNRVPQFDRTTQDLALIDIDGDLDPDLFEGNENGNLLHINDGAGNFSDETAGRLPVGLNIETRKVAFGDVDGDDDLDIFLCNVAFLPGKDPQNRLFLNDGAGFFSDATASQLPADNDHTIDAIFEDVDLDTDLDLIIGNVFGAPVKVYRNDGAGVFTDATLEILGQHYFRDALGLIAADLNGDGLRDLYICDRNTSQNNKKDLLLLRQPLTAVTGTEKSTPIISLFPNPAIDYFFIRTALPDIQKVRILNSAGKLVRTLSAEAAGYGQYRCELKDTRLLTGIYFVEMAGVRKRLLIIAR